MSKDYMSEEGFEPIFGSQESLLACIKSTQIHVINLVIVP